jgi:hypothetical protein
MRLVFQHVLPRRRLAPAFALPDVGNAKDALAALKTVPAIVAAGDLDPWEGDKVAAVLQRTHRALCGQERPGLPEPQALRQVPADAAPESPAPTASAAPTVPSCALPRQFANDVRQAFGRRPPLPAAA